MSKELVQENAVAARPADSLLAVVARAAQDASIDVAKMRELIDLKREIEADEARKAYAAALATVQNEMPRITKAGAILNKERQVQSRFARLEDIDAGLRPLLADNGFALTFNTEATVKDTIVKGTLTHRLGHSETKQISLPLDTSGSKNGIQGMGSTFAYGRRYITKMFFNVIEENEDDDGNGGSQMIGTEEVSLLAKKIKELAGKPENEPRVTERFLKFMGVEQLSDILVKNLPKAINALRPKVGAR